MSFETHVDDLTYSLMYMFKLSLFAAAFFAFLLWSTAYGVWRSCRSCASTERWRSAEPRVA
jgi:hypothetical protein